MTDELMKRLLAECYKEAACSPDPSTQIGAMIVSGETEPWLGTLSHNRPVYGWEMRDEDWERPRKYDLMVHGEQAAILKATRQGIPLMFTTMIASWAACATCARCIVESGINRLVRHYPPLDEATERWLSSVTMGDQILKNGGVEIVDVIGTIPGASKILRNGELYDPTN